MTSRMIRRFATMMIGVGSIMAGIGALAQTVPETVFVTTNAADRNEVVAFERGNDGSFYEEGRFQTGGRGSGGTIDPLQSQGVLTLNHDHTLLFVANSGSGTVSVFRVSQGSLSLIDQVPSGGSEPVSVAELNNTVYVLDGAAAGAVSVFKVGLDGHLLQVPNSTLYLSGSGVGGSSISIRPDGKVLAVTERAANNIDTFQIKADGTLAPIVVNASKAPGVFSATFAPDGNLIVSETGPAGTTNESAISSYSILSNGSLSAVTQSIPTFGTANCWDAVTPNGNFVYASNATSGTLAGFAIGKGGALTPIGGTIVATNPEGSANLDITVSSDGKYLFTLNSGAGTIGVFAILNDGTLSSEGTISGITAASGFQGIAAL